MEQARARIVKSTFVEYHFELGYQVRPRVFFPAREEIMEAIQVEGTRDGLNPTDLGRITALAALPKGATP